MRLRGAILIGYWQNPVPGLASRNSQAQLTPAFIAGFLLRDSAHFYYGGLDGSTSVRRFL